MKETKRKIILGSAAALMAVGGISPAFAEGVVTASGNTIDPTKKGSITLYKLQSTDGASKDSTALEQEVTEKGIEGVKFNIVKVGELVQVDINEGEVDQNAESGVYYTLTDEFKAKLKAIGAEVTADVTKDGVEYFTAETVNAAMKTANDNEAASTDATGVDTANEQLIRFAKEATGIIEMDATDENGKTVKSDLDLGLYLVAEVESPADLGDGETQSVAKAARPFLVALPMTNISTIEDGDVTHEAGTVWQYDVTAYPKNEMISVRKDIIADGNDTKDGEAEDRNGLVQTTNKNVGDYVNFLLTTDLPALQKKTNEYNDANGLRKYIITDTMSEGLTLDDTSADNFTVTYGDVWNNEGNREMQYGEDYTVDLDTETNVITVTMTETGLAELSQVSQDCKVFVNYKARLNAKSVNKENGAIKVEDNKFKLTYGTKTSRDYEFKSNEDVRVYTYEIDIAKKFSHKVDDDDMRKVSFSIKGLKDDGSGEYEQIKFIREADGVYHKYDGKEVDIDSKADSELILEEVNCASGGKLILKGLDARMYIVTEENTVPGYNLMRDTITVNFDDTYKQDGKVDTADLASGTYSDEKKISITNEDLEKGVVSFSIKNNETIEALHTGGTGWARGLAALGTTAILAGGALFVFKKKKEHEE